MRITLYPFSYSIAPNIGIVNTPRIFHIASKKFGYSAQNIHIPTNTKSPASSHGCRGFPNLRQGQACLRLCPAEEVT